MHQNVIGGSLLVDKQNVFIFLSVSSICGRECDSFVTLRKLDAISGPKNITLLLAGFMFSTADQ